MKTTLSFQGGAELARTLNALPTKVQREAALDALEAAAAPMVSVARKLAPRRPGHPDIADNIEIQRGRGGVDSFGDRRADSVAWGPLKGFFYGHYLEHGTVHASAHPFMRPGFDQNVTRSLDILKARLWENIESYVQSRDVR